MSKGKLSKKQNEKINKLLNDVRSKLTKMGAGDPALLFSYRRRIYLRLMHDERGTPAHRKRLKRLKMIEQRGKCAWCKGRLPPTEAELDRIVASAGYTIENTRLLHHRCHREQQREIGFKAKPLPTIRKR